MPSLGGLIKNKINFSYTGTVRFELTTFIRSTRFQDERYKPDSTKYPVSNLI